ncbi:MAG: prepilin-type N-terminal cleavage/methylation domain-containing protein [Lentisphaeria bacterium]
MIFKRSHPRFPVRCLKPGRCAFTLVELLAVLVVLAVLLSLLLPVLGTAKGAAKSAVCLNNLGQLGRAMMLYGGEADGHYPPAFLYRGMAFQDGRELPETPGWGYQHWSGLLMASGLAAAASFRCPVFDRGGLAPANTTPDNLDPGQANETAGIVDDQVPRCAYTVNQALCSANHFVAGFQGAYRACRTAAAASVSSPASTILATEWATDWRLTAGPGGRVCRSYLPVHGFVGLGPAAGADRFDSRFFGCPRPCFASIRRLSPLELAVPPQPGAAGLTRLDRVGRNHNRKLGSMGTRTSNFVFADGHAVNTTIFDTLQPFQWGAQFFSLAPGDDVAD